MLRILIADDHEIVRKGVRDVIEGHPGWEVCAEASDGQQALDLALKGADQPSGYTEPLLHAAREKVKTQGETRPA